MDKGYSPTPENKKPPPNYGADMTFALTESATYPGTYYLFDASHSGAVALIKKTDAGYEIRTRTDVKLWRDGIELQEPYVETDPDVLASDYPSGN